MHFHDTLIIIPARLGATRLPGKPLADICGKPMIVHVWERAVQSGIGEVLVACDDEKIADAIRAAGGKAILTRVDHASGSDRIWEAYTHFDLEGRYDKIVNLQGDMPTFDSDLIFKVLELLNNPETDIGTLICPIHEEEEKSDPAVVKPVIAFAPDGKTGRALYFTRCPAPYGEGELYHHIGIYAYRRDSLRRFVAMAPSPLELREKLEQLRALENGMRIDAAVVDTVPLGVDTPQHLEKARRLLS